MARGSNDEAVSNGQPEAGRLEAIEREHVEQLARAHAALAAAQDRTYWLERWGVDLNELMRRPGAGRVRAALRGVRELKRAAIAVRRYGGARVSEMRRSAADEAPASPQPTGLSAADQAPSRE